MGNTPTHNHSERDRKDTKEPCKNPHSISSANEKVFLMEARHAVGPVRPTWTGFPGRRTDRSGVSTFDFISVVCLGLFKQLVLSLAPKLDSD